MAIAQETHWDNVGVEPGAGDAEYVAGDQPISEYDNWFNWSAAKDVENLIAALENITTGHDHDGANSKAVDGSDVVNTPAGNIVATDVQAALNELDTEKLEKALFDVNTIVKADSDDTPSALTVAEQTLVGRITAGVITALNAAQVRTLLNVEDGAEVNNISDPNATDLTDAGESTLHYHASDRALADATGQLVETNGGTNQTTFAQGDIMYASAPDVLSKLAKGPAKQILTMNAGGTVPEWATGTVIETGSYTGDGTANRAIAHGLGVTPKFVFIMSRTPASNDGSEIVNNVYLGHTDSGGHTKVTITAKDSTNFYVNQTNVSNSGAVVYDWVAIG